MPRRDVIRFLSFRTIGNFLILFTIFGFVATFGPALYYEVIYRIGVSNGIRFRIAETTLQKSQLDRLVEQQESSQVSEGAKEKVGGGFLEAILSGQKEQILLPKSTDFGIIIPKIGANAAVFANTDPSNEREYLSILSRGVAHARGSAFPGLPGNIYLFAHSADNFWNVGRYNAIFYLLKELGAGDDVVVFFQGVRHDYSVTEQKIVDPEDTSHISANLGNGETLILQTCWPPGTTWKRLLVFAKPK